MSVAASVVLTQTFQKPPGIISVCPEPDTLFPFVAPAGADAWLRRNSNPEPSACAALLERIRPSEINPGGVKASWVQVVVSPGATLATSWFGAWFIVVCMVVLLQTMLPGQGSRVKDYRRPEREPFFWPKEPYPPERFAFFGGFILNGGGVLLWTLTPSSAAAPVASAPAAPCS